MAQTRTQTKMDELISLLGEFSIKFSLGEKGNEIIVKADVLRIEFSPTARAVFDAGVADIEIEDLVVLKRVAVRGNTANGKREKEILLPRSVKVIYDFFNIVFQF